MLLLGPLRCSALLPLPTLLLLVLGLCSDSTGGVTHHGWQWRVSPNQPQPAGLDRQPGHSAPVSWDFGSPIIISPELVVG